MAPGPVIEDFNVIEDIRPGQIPGFVYSLPDAPFFQRTDERFGHRIDAPMSIARTTLSQEGVVLALNVILTLAWGKYG